MVVITKSETWETEICENSGALFDTDYDDNMDVVF